MHTITPHNREREYGINIQAHVNAVCAARQDADDDDDDDDDDSDDDDRSNATQRPHD